MLKEQLKQNDNLRQSYPKCTLTILNISMNLTLEIIKVFFLAKHRFDSLAEQVSNWTLCTLLFAVQHRKYHPTSMDQKKYTHQIHYIGISFKHREGKFSVSFDTSFRLICFIIENTFFRRI